MQKTDKRLSFLCSAFFACYYVMMYVVAVMFSSYLVASGFDKGTVAAMSSISSLLLLFSKPLFAAVVDRGRCRELALGCCCSIALGSCVFFFSSERTMLHAVLYAVLCSVGNGVFMELSDAWVLKLIKETGAVDYGRTRAFGSASFALTGLVYGDAITRFGFGIAPFCILALLAMLAAVSLLMPQPQGRQAGERGALAGAAHLLRQPLFVPFLICSSVAGTTLGLLDSFVPVLITEKGGSAFHTGLASFVMAFIEFGMLRCYSRVEKKLGVLRVLGIGILGFGVKALVISLMPTPELIIAACCCQVFSFCLEIPGKMSFLQHRVDQSELATALTLCSIFSSLLSSLIASPMAGYISVHYSTGAMMQVLAAACLLAGGGFLLAVCRSGERDEA